MKKMFAKAARAAALTLVLATPVTTAYAGCWAEYLVELDHCDRLGGLTEVGCNIDASMYYAKCVGSAATN